MMRQLPKLKSSLKVILAVSMGVSQPMSAQSAPSSGFETLLLRNQEISQLMARARYGQTPSYIQKGRPNEGEISSLEKELAAWKHNLQTFWSKNLYQQAQVIQREVPSNDGSESSNYTISAPSLEILTYFEKVAQLAALKRLAHTNANLSEWLNYWSLKFKGQDLANLQWISELAKLNTQNALGEVPFQSQLNSQGELILSVNPKLMADLEELAWSSQPTRMGVARLGQYMALRTLLKNLHLAHELSPTTLKPQLPPEAVKLFPALEAQHHYEFLMRERSRRMILKNEILDQWLEMTAVIDTNTQNIFASVSFLEKVDRILGTPFAQTVQAEPSRINQIDLLTSWSGGDNYTTLLPSLLDLRLLDGLENPLTQLDLPSLVAEAKAMAFRNQVYLSEALSGIAQENKEDLDKLIKARTIELTEYLKSSIGQQSNLALASWKSQVDPTELTKSFTQDSLRLANQISAIKTSPEHAVHPLSYFTAREGDLTKLKLNPEAQTSLQEIMSAPNWLDSENRLKESLQVKMSFLKNSQVPQETLSLNDPDKLIRYLEGATYSDPAFANQKSELIQSIGQNRKNELHGLIKGAQTLGLLPSRTKEPLRKDLPLSDKQVPTYEEALTQVMLSEFPLYSRTLSVSGMTLPLWQALVRYPDEAEDLLKKELGQLHQEVQCEMTEVVTGRSCSNSKVFTAVAKGPSWIVDKVSSIWKSASQDSPQDLNTDELPDEVVQILSRSLALSRQLANYSVMLEPYKVLLAEAAEISRVRSSWQSITTANHMVMTTLIVWQLTEWLSGVAARNPGSGLAFKSAFKGLASHKLKPAFGNTKTTGPIGTWLDSFKKSSRTRSLALHTLMKDIGARSLNPMFGARLVGLLLPSLAIILMDLSEQGHHSIFVLGEQKDQLQRLAQCSVEGACLSDLNDYNEFSDSVSQKRLTWGLSVGILAAMLGGLVAAQWYFKTKLPAVYRDRLKERFDNNLNMLNLSKDDLIKGEGYIRGRAAQIRASLNGTTHPLFDSTWRRQQGLPRAAETQAREIVTKGVDDAAEQILTDLNRELSRWRLGAEMHKRQIKALNLSTRSGDKNVWYNPQVLLQKEEELGVALASGHITRGQYHYLRSSIRELYDFVAPVWSAALKDPFYAHILKSTLRILETPRFYKDLSSPAYSAFAQNRPYDELWLKNRAVMVPGQRGASIIPEGSHRATGVEKPIPLKEGWHPPGRVLTILDKLAGIDRWNPGKQTLLEGPTHIRLLKDLRGEP